MEYSQEHVIQPTYVLRRPSSFDITNTRVIFKETIERSLSHPIKILHSQCKVPGLFGQTVQTNSYLLRFTINCKQAPSVCKHYSVALKCSACGPVQSIKLVVKYYPTLFHIVASRQMQEHMLGALIQIAVVLLVDD